MARGVFRERERDNDNDNDKCFNEYRPFAHFMGEQLKHETMTES